MTKKIRRMVKLGSRRAFVHKGRSRFAEIRQFLSNGVVEWRDLNTGKVFRVAPEQRLRRSRPEAILAAAAIAECEDVLRWVDHTTGASINAKDRGEIERLARDNGLSIRATQEVVLEKKAAAR